VKNSELIHHQEDSRNRLPVACRKAGQVLEAGVTEAFAGQPQLGIEPLRTLRPNSRSLSMATTRACGSSSWRKSELDPFLNRSGKLDLLGAIDQRQVRDERCIAWICPKYMRRRGRAATCPGRAEMLPFGRPGPAERHVDAARLSLVHHCSAAVV